MTQTEERDYDERAYVDLGPPIMITVTQAAALAQVGEFRIREWAQEDGFPMLRATPRQVRIHARLFEEWLARRSTGGTP